MHPNTEIARRAYDAFLTGDMETMGALMSDEIVWHAPGDNALSGTYSGKDVRHLDVPLLFVVIGAIVGQLRK